MLSTRNPDNACIKIKRLSESIDRTLNSRLSDDDLTLTQCRILYTLAHCTDDGSATQKEIEDYLSISHPTAIGLFRRMESKDLIENLGRTGKSSKTIRITPHGNRMINRNEIHIHEMEKLIESVLGEIGYHSLKSHLDLVYDELSKKE